MELDIANIDITLYFKVEGKVRESKETLSDRVYLTRTEQLYHKRNTSWWVKVILVRKYIDDKEVNAWSWIEEVGKDELGTWVKKHYSPEKYQQKKELSQEDLDKQKDEKKKMNNTYYQLHREEILARKREYNRTHREQNNQQARRYYQAHKEQIKEYNRKYRETHLEADKESKLKYRLKKQKEKYYGKTNKETDIPQDVIQ